MHPSLSFFGSLLLLAFCPAAIAQTARSAESFPEGRFESGLNEKGAPKGWAIDPPQWKNSPHLTLSLLAEPAAIAGGPENHFVRLENTAAPDEESIFRLSIIKPLPVPTPARINVGWRVRADVEATSRINGWSSIQLTARFTDAKGNVVGEHAEIFRLIRSTKDRWIEREQTLEIPHGATDVELLPGLYLVKGFVDIDDITLAAVKE